MKRFPISEATDKPVIRNPMLATITALAPALAVVIPLGLMSGCDNAGYSSVVNVSIPQTDEIRCKTLDVVNKDDKVVVSIKTDDDGNGLLTVFAADGETILATLPMQ